MKIYLKITFFLFAFSWSIAQTVTLGEVIERIQPEKGMSYSDVYFNLDQKNRPILCLSKYDEDKDENVLCFAMYNLETKQFSELQPIEETRGMQAHAESMAKLGIKSDGTFVAVFRIKESNPKNRFAGSLYYTFSTDQGKSWSARQKLVKVPNASSQSFFDLERLSNGELGMVWLDSRKSENQTFGSALYFGTTDASNSFDNQKVIVTGTCQCCRTDIQVSQKGDIHVALRMMNEANIRDMYYFRSEDNGLHFSHRLNISPDRWEISGCPHTGPSMAESNENLAVAWYTMGGKPGVYFSLFKDAKDAFSNRVLIESDAAHPQMSAFSNEVYALVFEETKPDLKDYSRKISLSLIRGGLEYNRIQLNEAGSDNHHPVISKLSNSELLIAWTEVQESGSIIRYRTVILD